MKLIISYEGRRVEMFSADSLEGLTFADSCLQLSFNSGNVEYIDWTKIRSIVIA